MPIDRERFEHLSADALDVTEGTNAYAVLEFLADTPEAAYTRGEVREGTGVADGSVGPVLSRLAEQGLVEHRGRYWALDESVTDW